MEEYKKYLRKDNIIYIVGSMYILNSKIYYSYKDIEFNLNKLRIIHNISGNTKCITDNLHKNEYGIVLSYKNK